MAPVVGLKWNVSVQCDTIDLRKISFVLCVQRCPAALRSPSEELEAGMPRGTGPSALC